MPAYWIARAKINDPVEYKKYTDRVPAILEKYGGRVLARGGRYEVLEGPTVKLPLLVKAALVSLNATVSGPSVMTGR